ncbi:ABC-type transport auxiliary lipoprotein family protein, partial [Guyparkeria sp. 1SP6A2]|nr:ABC-type transport auxiliary lipoprotein family protein [Guyparkeria sp. 1SP6A2]
LMSLSRDSNNVRLNVYWDLIDNQVNRHITQQHFTAVTKAGATAPDMVSAYSHLLAQLSEQIDKSLQQLPD